MQQSDFMTTPEAAKLLRVSPRTLEGWRVSGRGPYFYKIGFNVLYKLSDLVKFVESSRRRSTSENTAAA